MNISLDKLRYFISAAELQHVGLAAKAMSISPSVISASIANIEEEFQVSLFDRRANRIYLNDNGRLLLKECRSILKQVNNIPTKLFNTHLLNGNIRIAGSHYLSTNILKAAFFTLQKNNPMVTGEIHAVDTGVAIANLLSGVTDLAIVFNPIKHELLEESVLYKGDFLLVVGKNHPVLKLKLSKNKQILELNNYQSVSYRASVGSNYCENHPVFAKYGLKTNHSMFYDNDSLAIEHIKNFSSWAFLPDFIVNKHLKDLVVLRPKDWTAPMNVSAVIQRGRDNQIARELIKLLKKVEL